MNTSHAARYSVLDLPLNERFRERLMNLGPEAMSSTELIAIILGNGVKGTPVLQLAHDLQVRFGSLQSLDSLASAIVHPKQVFYPAVRQRAASLILIHNHPSGDPTPSPENIETTEVLIEAGLLMGIPN